MKPTSPRHVQVVAVKSGYTDKTGKQIAAKCYVHHFGRPIRFNSRAQKAQIAAAKAARKRERRERKKSNSTV